MPEHYTRNTLECTAYCRRCAKQTQHRVDGGRRGPCLECIKRLELHNEFERIKRGIEEEERAEKDPDESEIILRVRQLDVLPPSATA